MAQKIIAVAALAQLAVLVVIAAILATGTTVTVSNPIDTVTVTNPVDSVKVPEIEAVVQVAVPTEADLYGYCRREGASYRLSVTAITGGLAQTVAEGLFTEGAANLVGVSAAAYYGYPALTFGELSEECSHLAGWQ